MPGLALAFVISSYCQFSYYLWQTSKLVDKPVGYFFPFKKLLIKMLVAGTSMAVCYFSFKKTESKINLVAGIILAATLSITFLFYHYKNENKLKIT